MFKIEIIETGSGLGMNLPKKVLEELNIAVGDSILLTRSPEGFHILPYDPEFERDMNLAYDVMRKRRNALRKLAKS